jgi:leader peptidase (prepilin peptidase)/N-methyltransferase
MIGISILVLGTACMSALLVIDLRSHRLPDPLTLLLGLLGLGFHFLHNFELLPLPALLAGAILGALLLYALRAFYLRRRGIEALGLGDVKFVAAAGLWVGIDGIFLGIAFGALLTLAGLALLGLLRHRRLADFSSFWPDGQTRIPFGPGLILASVAVFLLQVWPLLSSAG